MGMGDLIIQQQEQDAAVDEILHVAGLLQKCEDHEEFYSDGDEDEDAFEAAEAKGVSRKDAEARIANHGMECSGCASRERNG
jgi:hypothetical protein